MPGYFGQQIQSGDLGGPFLRDFSHASRTFLSNGYALAPKFKFLFHVYFDINPQAYPQSLSTGDNFGLTVKTVKLPSYTFKTETLNQYNRKRIVQTKINYNPVNFTFHDDNSNMMTRMWNAYYTYYYGDGKSVNNIFNGVRGDTSTGQETDLAYNTRNVYDLSITGNVRWGYQGEGPGGTSNKIPFFKNITIFGFNRHDFTAYTLINPIISSFSHDTYNYSDGGGTMEMNMDLDYETVIYNEGAMDGQIPYNVVKGFALPQNYDPYLSPITPPGAERYYPGNGGYASAAGGFVNTMNGNNT